MIIGVLSDTHGTLHPRVIELFLGAGVQRVLHAGDVGDFEIISLLSAHWLVTAVRGNIDTRGPVATLPRGVRLEMESAIVYMTHIGGKPEVWLSGLMPPLPRVAVCGHSHVALNQEYGGVLFLNPGAAGIHSRFGRAPTVSIMEITSEQVTAVIYEL
ncbi:MAG TPA: metallophosphoesterase family protein [Chloroflexia bacterium]|nr:metallophosphoesterase family protein [Chloroflexia bacterium]